MAKNIMKAAAIMIVAACAFCACDKEALTPMEASNGYDSNAGKKVVKVTDPDDKIISYTYADAFERFVEGGTEYSFIPVTVYEKKGEVKGERISYIDPFNHKGIDRQQLSRQKEDTLKTSFGAATTIHEGLAKTAQEGWFKEVSGKVQNFSATNGADVVEHNTTTTVASMVYRAHNDSLVVEFPAPSFTLSESTSHADLGNALEYDSKVVATLSILEAFRKAGESSTKELVATNVAVLTNIPDNYTSTFEAQEYVGNFKVSNVSNFETEDQHNKYVRKTYNNGVLTEEKSFEMPLVLSAKIVRTSEARKSIDEVKNLTVSMTPNGADKTTFGTADENGYRAQRVTTNHTLRVSDGSTYNLEIVTENTVKDGKDEFDYAWFDAIEPVISLQPKLNSAESTASNPVYDVNVSVNLNVARTTRGQVQTKAAADEKEPYTIMASHQEVMTVTDDLVSSREEKVVTPKTNGFDIVARFFETYSLSGERMVSEQKGEMLFDINGSNGTAMVVKNVNFNTTGNGLNSTGNGTYSDTASNGTDSFNNTYSYSADNSKSLSYNGKTVTFTATFKIVENGQNIGSKTSSNGYDAYPYTNTVKGIYTVEGQSVEKTATATRELRVAQEVENLIGDIVSAGMSVVPSLKSGSSYVDGSGKRVATKCLTIRRANGTAAAIVFAYETETNVVIPTDAQIKGGNWVSGNYNDAYNSGVFMNGNWVPAVAKDQSYGISYSIPTKNDIRSIRNETLKQWGWRGGNFSTVLSNYNVTVEDGVCTIYYNGEVVKRFR